MKRFRSPAAAVRLAACVLAVLALAAFFAPFVTLSPNTDDTAVLFVQALKAMFGQDPTGPRNLSGVELIFAFTADSTIHPQLDIGPLPANAAVLAAAVLTLASLVFLFLPVRGRDLWSACLAGGSAVCVFVSCMKKLYFIPYYARFTKNGGEQLRRLLEEEKLLVRPNWGAVAVIVLCLFVFMIEMNLWSQLRYDPLFVKARGIGSDE
ncbi:MAG: hypothetical protein J6125_03845 [Clostridia bacterium]|nr:hypothetical protein [Clostridia bacterium]